MVCVECGEVDDHGAKGWRAVLGGLPGEDEQDYVVVYCAGCAEREFGPPARRS
jgi:hypothetical protein